MGRYIANSYLRNMKNERRCPAPPSTTVTDSAYALREENERLRAEVAYLKKL